MSLPNDEPRDDPQRGHHLGRADQALRPHPLLLPIQRMQDAPDIAGPQVQVSLLIGGVPQVGQELVPELRERSSVAPVLGQGDLAIVASTAPAGSRNTAIHTEAGLTALVAPLPL